MLRDHRRSNAGERNFSRDQPRFSSVAVQTRSAGLPPAAILLLPTRQSERPQPSREGSPGRKDPPVCRRPPFSWSPSRSSLW
uniref:Ethanolamine kinase 1 n=1 Tax=Molossus molossus TaxID=27622 RepID=A0A7J8FXQ9_MOLMO|nr:ethanolamine kinase 1 [Molossus molossus]